MSVEVSMTPKRSLISLMALSVAGTFGLAACGGTSHPASTRPPAVPAAQSISTAGSDLLVASTTPTDGRPTVTTEGVGMVTGDPDTVTLEIGVSTTGVHAADALGENNSLAASVEAVLEAHGVTAQNIQTTNLDVQQNWGSKGPSGYSAEDDLTVTIHDVAGAGALIDEALAPAGDAARLDSVQFSLSNSSPLLAEARQQAVVSARAQALQMAEAAGEHLGALISLSDVQPASNNVTYPATFNAAASPAAAVPLQAGSQQVSVDVTGVWQILPGS